MGIFELRIMLTCQKCNNKKNKIIDTNEHFYYLCNNCLMDLSNKKTELINLFDNVLKNLRNLQTNLLDETADYSTSSKDYLEIDEEIKKYKNKFNTLLKQ